MRACYTFDKFNNNCSTSRARVIGMLQCTFKVYLLAIFSEDELMSDTLIQYCSERESHMFIRTRTCTDQDPQFHRPVEKNDVPEALIKITVLNPFLSITTEMLPAHIILLTASSYVDLIRHSLTESRPLYVYTCMYTIGSNCPGISGTVSDLLPLSRVPEGPIVCPGSKLGSCTMDNKPQVYYPG